MIGMKILVLVVAVLVSYGTAQRGASRAAAPAPGGNDCLCQCISLQYVDSYGVRHGNCASTINGAQWCYVKYDWFSPCIDKRSSQRFSGKYWSYHACATPSPNSPICQYEFPPPIFSSARSSSVAKSGVPDNVY